MYLTTQVVLFAVCIGLSAFFAAAEIALVSLSEARVRSMVAKHRFGSTSIKKLKDSLACFVWVSSRACMAWLVAHVSVKPMEWQSHFLSHDIL